MTSDPSALRLDLEELTDADGPPTARQDEAFRPRYPTSSAWFKGWFHQVIERQQTQSLIWCPRWWAHPEALAIIDALWWSWEGARVSRDPDAMLAWWERTVGMINHLTSRTFGPFAACTPDEHREIDLSLPYQREPAGYFGIILDEDPTTSAQGL
jgi:hypothetical protein